MWSHVDFVSDEQRRSDPFLHCDSLTDGWHKDLTVATGIGSAPTVLEALSEAVTSCEKFLVLFSREL